MRKPEQLRALLLRVVPHLRTNPDALALFVDQGTVAARDGTSLSFEYRYKLNLVVQDYAGDRNAVVVPLLAWLAQAQPERLAAPDSEPFAFEAELLDGDLCDLSFKLDLTERVAVVQQAGGGYAARHLDERTTADLFPDVCDATLWQIFLRDELAAPVPDPSIA